MCGRGAGVACSRQGRVHWTRQSSVCWTSPRGCWGHLGKQVAPGARGKAQAWRGGSCDAGSVGRTTHDAAAISEAAAGTQKRGRQRSSSSPRSSPLPAGIQEEKRSLCVTALLTRVRYLCSSREQLTVSPPRRLIAAPVLRVHMCEMGRGQEAWGPRQPDGGQEDGNHGSRGLSVVRGTGKLCTWRKATSRIFTVGTSCTGTQPGRMGAAGHGD